MANNPSLAQFKDCFEIFSRVYVRVCVRVFVKINVKNISY